MMRPLCTYMLAAALLLTSACGTPTPLPTASPAPSAVASATPPGGTPTGTPLATPSATPSGTPDASPTLIRPDEAVTLTVWTADTLAPDAGTPAGALLIVQLATFEQTHPQVHLEVVRKKPYGPGGLLDFLTSAAPVAPGVLPDLLTLDASELPAAARAGLIVPLESALADDLVDDLYPFAKTLGTVDRHLVGVPFGADVQHLAYNRNVQAAPPLTWSDVVSSSARLSFAAGDPSAMDATLADYLAAGGTLLDAGGRPHLDVAPLTEVLRYYKTGQASGQFIDSVAQIESPADAWALYRSGKVTQTLVDASLYLSEREDLRATQVAVPPGPTRPAPGTARAWAWAVPQRGDPVRQQLAVELLNWLVAPENLSGWTLAAQRLPARRAALDLWPADDPYVTFLTAYLETVIPEPAAEIKAKVMPALHTAVQAVLVNDVAPEVAAAAAMAEVQR